MRDILSAQSAKSASNLKPKEFMSTTGTIYWIGAGPGSPDLLTVKGLALLQEADAVVCNALAHPQLLRHARPDADIVDVGSLTSGNRLPPPEINRRLILRAQQGKTIVRLWEGDPFVFTRAAEEMAAAVAAGLRVEFVPGISSALAAPAFAGVPVTHWQHAASFAVVAGFLTDDAATRPNWAALAQIDTLIILMPLQNLSAITAELLAAGRAAATPALVVQHGTLPQQRQVRATLGTLVEAVQSAGIQRPAVVVLGDVVTLADELAWFRPENYPLLGQRVLVTRPRHQTAEFMASLRDLGAEPVAFPTIEIRPAEDTAPLDDALRQICRQTAAAVGRGGNMAGDAFDWLVVTSANGVTAVWERLAALGVDSRCLASVRVAAIGPATAAALQGYSITPDLMPAEYTAEGVLAEFDRLGPVTGQRFLLARADIARATLAEGLRERGAIVSEIPAYRTVPVEGGPTPPPADVVTFTSSSTVQGYVNCLAGVDPAQALKGSRVVCIGPITAKTARQLGVPVAAVAKEYTIDGLLAVLKNNGEA